MSESIMSPPPVISGSVRPLDRVCREEAHETLMDRVLVTPMKKSGRVSRRFTSRSKPNAPLYSLRHHSQRSSSSHAFAPYPKRNVILNAPEKFPKTPKNKLRRTLSDWSYFTSSATPEKLSSMIRRPMVDSHSPSKQARRPSKPNCIRIKPFNALLATASSNLGFSGIPTHREADLSPDRIAMRAKHSTQDMDIALDFQALHLGDHNASLAVDFDGRSPSRKGHGHKALDLLVTRQFFQYQFSWFASLIPPRFPFGNDLSPHSQSWTASHICFNSPGLQTALAAEIKARSEAEQQLVREIKRRVEMEELVAQLQHERDELALTQHPFASSSPLLLSSSPCILYKSAINSALPLPP